MQTQSCTCCPIHLQTSEISHGCHKGQCSNEEQNPWIGRLEIICSVAFATFSLSVAPGAFGTFFAIGLLYEFTVRQLNIKTSMQADARPGCGQGNGEMFAGRGLLSYEVVLVTGALFFEHLQHHPEFFVPFLGFWLGVRSVVNATHYLQHQNFNWTIYPRSN